MCLEVYFEFLNGVEKQGERYGKRVSKNIADLKPSGPKGKK